jgi:hypothetical protein
MGFSAVESKGSSVAGQRGTSSVILDWQTNMVERDAARKPL